MFQGSWKSTTAGIVALVAVISGALSLLLDDNPETNPDWNVVFAVAASIIAQIFNGVGLLFTRDNNITSEEAGAK